MGEILPRYYEEAEHVWGQLSSRRASELIADLHKAARNAERFASEAPV